MVLIFNECAVGPFDDHHGQLIGTCFHKGGDVEFSGAPGVFGVPCSGTVHKEDEVTFGAFKVDHSTP